ncbi:MAG: peptide deformylase [Elusimicrobia bacterium CG08_land_8_20_14_0_20_51_18]|nr:MAG: peptide deformylase [Elusimicrobia bacterium CG08_land_8_20_14_0_20_51_18]
MPVRRICKYGEQILSKKTEKVDFKKIKGELPKILGDMLDTLDLVRGAGLAANQIGLDMQLAIVRIKEEEREMDFVLINPVLAEKSGEIAEDEGCLSFPGLFARVKRHAKVKVRALNEKGVPVEITGTGLLARALQHEIDHLNGIVFLDHLSLLTRLRLKPVLMKLKRQWKKMDESKGMQKPM